MRHFRLKTVAALAGCSEFEARQWLRRGQVAEPALPYQWSLAETIGLALTKRWAERAPLDRVKLVVSHAWPAIEELFVAETGGVERSKLPEIFMLEATATNGEWVDPALAHGWGDLVTKMEQLRGVGASRVMWTDLRMIYLLVTDRWIQLVLQEGAERDAKREQANA